MTLVANYASRARKVTNRRILTKPIHQVLPRLVQASPLCHQTKLLLMRTEMQKQKRDAWASFC